MKHPIFLIIFGLLLISIGFNILQHSTINKLNYKIKKFEAGPWRSILEPPKKDKPNIQIYPHKNFTII